MFRFQFPDHLYFLALLPVLALLLYMGWLYRKKTLEKLGEISLLKQLMPAFSRKRYWFKSGLLLLAICFLIVGWANPQWGTKKEKVVRKGIDVFIAIDISQSMLAEDIAPNRLERAGRFARNLINAMAGNRVGIILFAGNAYLQMPLTSDYAAAELFIRSANPDMAATQGTAIGDAIDLALRAFEQNDKHHKCLIIISDGENHEEEAPVKAAEAAERGVLLFNVGVGTAEGGLIPISVRGHQDFKRDKSGNPVRTSLNESMLKEIAEKGNGSYFNLNAGDEAIIQELSERIDRIEKREYEQRSFSEYESYFQYFLGISLLLLIGEHLLVYRQKKNN